MVVYTGYCQYYVHSQDFEDRLPREKQVPRLEKYIKLHYLYFSVILFSSSMTVTFLVYFLTIVGVYFNVCI